LQALPFFQVLAAFRLPLESYVGQLRALAVIHAVLEQALATCSEPRVAAVWRSDLRKFPRLQEDLRFFEPRAVADLKEPAEAALVIAGQLSRQSVEQPLALLGALYVLEGSMLGAQVLRRLYAQAFLLNGEEGLAYLATYGAEAPARWAEFQQRLNAIQLNPEERGQVAQAATELFAQLEEIFRGLYPVKPESRTVLVTSINPEAGRHAVPADPRELEVALRAADACWQRWPYFEQRYGERGRRFARSDGVWLATLPRFEAAQMSQQVRWLGRVLAARGMPTLLLQDHLEILAEHLISALPAHRPAYERLRQAAGELQARRGQHLPEERARVAAAEFDRAVGPEWSARLPRTGALLAAAVADESGQHPGAVESLRLWLVDTSRFPADWIAAVESTLGQLRR
jgi:heme oxygenase